MKCPLVTDYNKLNIVFLSSVAFFVGSSVLLSGSYVLGNLTLHLKRVTSKTDELKQYTFIPDINQIQTRMISLWFTSKGKCR